MSDIKQKLVIEQLEFSKEGMKRAIWNVCMYAVCALLTVIAGWIFIDVGIWPFVVLPICFAMFMPLSAMAHDSYWLYLRHKETYEDLKKQL